MSEMSKENVAMLWEKISGHKKATILDKINEMVKTNIKNTKLMPHTKFDWAVNIAFDKEQPIEYIYVKGDLIIVPQNRLIHKIENAVLISVNYIQVSQNADDFLDMKNHLTKQSESIFLYDSTSPDAKFPTDQANDEVNDEATEEILNPESIEQAVEEILEEMEDYFIDADSTLRKFGQHERISLKKLKESFIIMKLAQLQLEINNLKTKLK